MTCFDCLRCKECAKQDKTMLIVDSIGEYVYQRKIEKYCPNFLDGDAALDLINHLKAEIEKLERDLAFAETISRARHNKIEKLSGKVVDHMAEIERLQKHNTEMAFKHHRDGAKEFAERLKQKAYLDDGVTGFQDLIIDAADIDNLLKELDGKENGNA